MMGMSRRATPEGARRPLRVSDLARNRPTPFSLVPGPEWRAELAELAGLDGLARLRFEGRLLPEGRGDWRLEARLGATVTQACVVTFAPVRTRIDTPVERIFVARLSEVEADAAGAEMEMPDDRVEALGTVIDLEAIMTEALMLALPDYPRADGVEPARIEAIPAGAAALDTPAASPFAALAGLRAPLSDNEDGT